MNWFFHTVTIYQEIRKKKFISAELSRCISDGNIENVSKIHYVVSETARNYLAIDIILSQFIKKKKTPTRIYSILSCACAALLFCKNIPEYTVCNEAVNISGNKHKKLVNAVLRNILRTADLFSSLSVHERYSIPQWFVKNISEPHIPDDETRLFEKLNDPPLLCVRINTQKTNIKEFTEHIAETAEINRIVGHNTVILDSWKKFSHSPLFRDGSFYIQNLSSILAYNSLPFSPQSKILDVCAAPGGKAFLLADQYPESTIICTDKNTERLSLIEQNKQRLHNSNVEIVEKIPENQLFDAVIVDAPCSCSGTIAAHPEWKIHHCSEELSCIETQRQLLKRSANYVKKNGYMVYSTCSLFYKENEENIQWFLKQNKNFLLHTFTIKELRKKVYGYFTFLPWEFDDCEGFFIALLKKV